jgi:hypothetical protein
MAGFGVRFAAVVRMAPPPACLGPYAEFATNRAFAPFSSSVRHGRDGSMVPQLPKPPGAPVARPPFPQRRRSQGYWVAAAMRQMPGARFLCGCVCLQAEDRKQLRRIFRITRAASRARRF